MISLRGRAPGVAVVVASGVALAIAGPGLALPGGAAPVAAHHLVEIRGLRFEPAELVVTAGDTVTWVNRDVVPHTATAADEAWTSGELGPDGSWSRIAGTGGGWEYVCAYHPEMRGRVVVKRESRTPADPSGRRRTLPGVLDRGPARRHAGPGRAGRLPSAGRTEST